MNSYSFIPSVLLSSENILLKLKFLQWTFGVLIPILRRIILDEFIFATSDSWEQGEIIKHSIKLQKVKYFILILLYVNIGSRFN